MREEAVYRGRTVSLDLYLRKNGQADGDPPAELSLEDDGYYWFLHPWFERLRAQCGKFLDLYGDVVFTADDFPRLRQLLDDASASAREQPASWEVCVGQQTRPMPRKIYHSVRRDQLMALLDDLRSIVSQAERTGQQIECIGD